MLWSFLISIVLGVIPALTFLSALSPWLGRPQFPDVTGVWFCVLISVSISIFVSSFTLALRDRGEAATSNRTRRRVVRCLFVLAALSIVPANRLIFGPNSSPLFAQRRQLPEEVVSAYFRFWPETDYFKLEGKPDAVFHVTVPPDTSLVLGEGQRIERENSNLLISLPDGSGPLAVSNARYEYGSVTASVIFRPMLRLTVTEMKTETKSDPDLGDVQASVAKKADGRTLLSLSGKLPDPLPADEIIKVFLFEPEKSGFLSASDIDRQGSVIPNRQRPDPIGRLLQHFVSMADGTGGQSQRGERFLPYPVPMKKDGEWSLTLYGITQPEKETLLRELGRKTRQAEKEAFRDPLRRAPRREGTPSDRGYRFWEMPRAEKEAHLVPPVGVDVGVTVVPIRADELADNAMDLAKQGRFSEALVLEGRALEKMGPNPDPFYLNQHARTLLRLGKLEESLDYARRAVKQDRENARRTVTQDINSSYLDTLAHAAYGLGSWEEAAQAWDEVLDQDGRFTSDAYCKQDAELDKTARDKAGLPPRPITPNP